MSRSLLSVDSIGVKYPTKGWRKAPFQALRNVSIEIRPGETLGLVGESGSGKTTLGRAILGLVETSSGSITFDGSDITNAPRSRRRSLARDLQVIFQDPYSSLNPSMTVGDTLAEPLLAAGAGKVEAHARVRELLDRVHLPSDALGRVPSEFSGGQRQRVAIARALAVKPRLIVCDEPVSALDLVTQAAVIELLIEIQRDTDVAYLFVSHDLSVVRAISHRIAVMFAGSMVETGSAKGLTESPTEAYTRKLLLAAPIANPVLQRERRHQRRALVDGADEGLGSLSELSS